MDNPKRTGLSTRLPVIKISVTKRPLLSLLLTAILTFLLTVTISTCRPNDDQYRLLLEEYRIECNPDSLDWLMKHFEQDNYIPVKVTRKGSTSNGKMRVRGDTSRGFSKKSLKIKMMLPDSTEETVNLNAEFLDKSYMHQHLCSRIYRLAGEPCFLTSYAPVYMNGIYYGLFLRIENMDEDFLKRNGLDRKANMYKAARDGASLSVSDSVEYHWEKKTNTKDSPYDLLRLIHGLDTCTPAGIVDYVKQMFDYPSLLRQVALNIYLCNGSTYYHNYFLYHDIRGNGKWKMFPWDMDKSLSYYDWKLPFEMNNGADPDNTLLYKLYMNKAFMKEVDEEINKIHRIVLDNDIPGHMQEVAELIEPWVEKDGRDKINDLTEWKQQVNKDAAFFKDNDTRRFQQLHHEFQPFIVTDLGHQPLLDPVFRWTRIPNDRKIGVRYDLYLSRDPKFDEKATTVVKAIEDTFHIPPAPLEKGTWYYKVVARKGALYLTGYGRHFHVTIDKATDFSTTAGSTVRLTQSGSPYRIRKDMIIEGGKSLVIEPGTVVYLDSGTSIRIKGSLVCAGDTMNRIRLRSSSGKAGWGMLELNGCRSTTRITHTDIHDGRLVYHHCDLELYDVIFDNYVADLDRMDGRPSLIWGQHGKFSMDRCKMTGNRTGEGINLHGGWPRVTNSVFLRVPDAIEFISADSGLIAGNEVSFSKDDGIDLNDCRNISICNNYIHDNFDKAVSAGVDHQGSSHRITITGNIFHRNAYGCDIKDSSDAVVSQNVMIGHRYAVLARQKEPGYQVGGRIDAASNVIIPAAGGTVFKTEGKSVINLRDNRTTVASEKGIVIDTSYLMNMTETPFFPKQLKGMEELKVLSPSVAMEVGDSEITITNTGRLTLDLGRAVLSSGKEKTAVLPVGLLLEPGQQLLLYSGSRKSLPPDWQRRLYFHEKNIEKKTSYRLSATDGTGLSETDQ